MKEDYLGEAIAGWLVLALWIGFDVAACGHRQVTQDALLSGRAAEVRLEERAKCYQEQKNVDLGLAPSSTLLTSPR